MKSKLTVSKVFSIILLLIFFSACDKGEVVSTDNLKQKLVLESDDITQAKDYFYKEIIPKKQLRDNINSRYYLYFDWKKASKIKNKEDNSSYISIPIFNTKSSIDEKAFAAISAKCYKDRKLPNVSKNLIIRENNLGVKTYEIYTYIPDEKKYKDSKIKNYWGYTLISDVNENFLRGFVVKDNKISSKILKSNAQKALKVSCEGWVEVITWQESLEGEAGIILHTLTINHPGDCGYNNDEDQAAGNYGDQGGSGGTGCSDGYLCGSSMQVSDNMTDPCFSNTLTRLSNNNWKGTANDILNQFNISPNYNIIFLNSEAPGDSHNDGDHIMLNSENHEITLNNNALTGASQNYIAATILHETIHALLGSQGKTDELIHHNEMANQYVYKMAHALELTFLMSNAEATALTWGGLGDTVAWQNLSPQQKQDILNINAYYKNINGTRQNAPGTKCD